MYGVNSGSGRGGGYQPSYYRPYSSDDELSDTESTTSTDSSELDFTSPLALIKAAGISLSNTTQQLKYGVDYVSRSLGYGEYIPPPPNSNNFYGKTTFDASTNRLESIVLLNSRDRDKAIYPQPTNLVLRLPRVYKNIVNLQFSQLKLLSAFYYFRPDKGNTTFFIAEQDRSNYNRLQGQPNGFPVTINPGSYDIVSLLKQLNIQMNTYPIFYDYVNGISDFSKEFTSTGDLGANFNEVGDYFYDILNDIYVSPPVLTKGYVTKTFFASQTVNQTSFVYNEILVAYYYPPLKLALLQNTSDPNINLNISDATAQYLLTSETVLSRVLYSFQGLNDPVVIEVINNNIAYLDKFRDLNTFKNALVNKYVAAYNSVTNIVTFTSPNLNTSLINLLNEEYSNYFFLELAKRNLTASNYGVYVTQIQQYNTVLLDMYDYIQQNLAKTFAVNYNTYSLGYLATPPNEIYITDGTNAKGIQTQFDLNLLKTAKQPISNFSLQVTPASNYWTTLDSAQSNTWWLVNSNTQFNKFYNMYNGTFLNEPLITPITSNIYIDVRTHSANAIVPVYAEKYTVFAFTSPVRQTLRVETLPRPLKYRYPEYNKYNYIPQVASVFDYSYEWIDNSNYDTPLNPEAVSPGTTWDTLITQLPLVFGQIYDPGFYVSYKRTCDTFTYLSELFYSVVVPPVPGAAGPSVNKYQVTAQFSINVGPVLVFFYHDRAAFMADIATPFNENPLHYKQSILLTTEDSVKTITWNAYENNRYYFLIRPQSNIFSRFTVKPSLYCPNDTQYISLSCNIAGFDPNTVPTDSNFGYNFNYARIYDPDYIRLPISSNLWAQEPTDFPSNNEISNSSPPIGYDKNNVSTDLTDYRPFNPYSRRAVYSIKNRFDPIAPTAALFTATSPYNISTQTYFYDGSQNQISLAPGYSNYTPSEVVEREFKIVNWFDQVYIGPTDVIQNISNAAYSSVPYSIETTCNTPIGGYLYKTNTVSGRVELDLFGSVCGFTFLPSDGIWNLKSMSFNSAVMNSSTNDNIMYIGIYNTGDIYDTAVQEVDLQKALVILSNVRIYHYLPNQDDNTDPNWLFEYNQNSSQYIFDSPYVQNGSYYYFEAIGGTASNLEGYTQNPRTFLNQPFDLYSAVAFTDSGSVATITQLTGSPVPFPGAGYSYPIVANTYLDGQSAITGQQVVVPSAISNLPYGTDYSQSSYEQSMPQTTCGLHIINVHNQIYDEAAFKPWYKLSSPLVAPTNIAALAQDDTGENGYVVIQDSIFRIFQYGSSGHNPIPVAELTFDDIFPPEQNTYFTAFATNQTSVIFMGLSNVSAASNQIVFKEYSLSGNSIGNLKPFIRVGNLLSVNEQVQQFKQVDNSGPNPGQGNYSAFTTYNTVTSNYSIYVSQNLTAPIQKLTILTPPGKNPEWNSNIPVSIELNITPSPNHFYMMNNSGMMLDLDLKNFFTSGTYNYNALSPDGEPVALITLTGISNIRNLVYISDTNTFSVIVTLSSSNTAYGNLVYDQQEDGHGRWHVQLGSQTFNTPITTMVSGYHRSRWIITGDYPYIYANRFVGDCSLNTSWQIFYPSFKMTFKKIANQPTPIVNLTNIEPPEWYHTNMFVYSSLSNLRADINTGWGNESSNNYLACDTQFNGFQFNSYIDNVPLQVGKTYYLAIRGYTPSEQFETLVRFVLPNRYDFRWIRLDDISGEIGIVLANGGISPSNFNPLYADCLMKYNEPFIGPRTYGGGIIPGFAGVSYNILPGHSNTNGWLGFGDVLEVFFEFYKSYQALNEIVSAINAATLSNLNNFISTQLKNILPPSALLRQKYTDPLLFSLLFKSGNNYAFANLEEEWGIGWNLGFPKQDTQFLTIQSGNSFFKILDDYVYIKLNDEFHLNRIDTSGKENLSATREPTGQVGGYNTKLLLTTFGGYAQTAINNPIQFNPPLGKLDRISFQLMDTTGSVISNVDCEWNAALQITEVLDQPTIASSIIKYR